MAGTVGSDVSLGHIKVCRSQSVAIFSYYMITFSMDAIEVHHFLSLQDQWVCQSVHNDWELIPGMS